MLQRGNLSGLNLFSLGDMNRLNRNVHRMPGATTQNANGTMVLIKIMIKIPSLTQRNKDLCME